MGDVDEWFCHFKICCKANEWNRATKAAKLPTLLEGEALAVWMALSEEDKEDYVKAKKAIKRKLLPTTFIALEKFNRRLMLQSEMLSLFLHETSNDYLIKPCRGYQKSLRTVVAASIPHWTTLRYINTITDNNRKGS